MLGSNYGQGTTFTATDSELYLNIEKEIMKYPSPRIELIKRLGSFSQPVNSHKIEWSRRDNRGVKSTVAVERLSGETTLIVADAGIFNVDDLIEGEAGQQLKVTAVSGGTQLTVAFWAGTDGNMDIGEDVKRIGMATAQGKTADNMVVSGYEDLYNYTSILEDVVDLSGTENEALIRGKENSGQLIARKQQELAEILQSQIVLGIRQKDDATKTTTMGGLKYLIDTYAPAANSVDFGGTATWAATGDSGPMGKLDDALDLLSAKVFDKPTMYVGAKWMRKFKYIMSDLIRTEQANDTRGIGKVGTYLSHLYGKIDVVLIQERTGFMDDLVFLVDESDAGYKAERNRGWRTYPLAKLGDSYRWQVLGEYTFKLGNPAAHAYLHNLGV